MIINEIHYWLRSPNGPKTFILITKSHDIEIKTIHDLEGIKEESVIGVLMVIPFDNTWMYKYRGPRGYKTEKRGFKTPNEARAALLVDRDDDFNTEEQIQSNDETLLERALKEHDWYYGFSDDGRVFRRGEASYTELVKIFNRTDREKALALWAKYAPKDFKAP
jgi:hypothetical protein